MTSLWSPRILSAVLLVLLLYVGAYVWFRQTSTEIWERDKQPYVIFPAGHGGGALYYLWRPLSYVDGSLTGMRFHIGPHR